MNEQVFKNLRNVKREAKDILENVERVRGRRYKLLLNGMLLTSNLVEIFHAIERFDDAEDEIKERIRDAFFHCVHSQVSNFMEAAGASESEVEDLTKDAESIASSVHNLADQAFNAGLSGNLFGGTD